MNGMKEGIGQDMRRDPEVLEQEADRARSRLEHTLEELGQRVSPGQMVDHAMRVIRENGGEFSSNLAAQVRNNPLPTVLALGGIVWLMASSRRPPPQPVEHAGTGRSIADRASSAAESVRGAAGSVQSRAHQAMSAASGAASRVAQSARSAGEHARSGVQSAREGFGYLSHEQPLVLGALAVAAGAVIGALLPATEAEDRWVGQASDDARNRLMEEGQRQAERARATTEAAREQPLVSPPPASPPPSF